MLNSQDILLLAPIVGATGIVALAVLLISTVLVARLDRTPVYRPSDRLKRRIEARRRGTASLKHMSRRDETLY